MKNVEKKSPMTLRFLWPSVNLHRSDDITPPDNMRHNTINNQNVAAGHNKDKMKIVKSVANNVHLHIVSCQNVMKYSPFVWPWTV